MNITKVGELFVPGKTGYPESAVFEYSPSGPILIIALGNPTTQEIEAAKTGHVELALFEAEPVIFILHKIRGIESWSDSPFSIRLYENIDFDWSQEIEEDMGLGLIIVLVDANAGIVHALRMVGTSTQFARELRGAILRQLEQPFSRATYDTKIDEIYRKHSSEDMLYHATAQHKIK
jgi:hypothetical protein